jgi:hypothetical protein
MHLVGAYRESSGSSGIFSASIRVRSTREHTSRRRRNRRYESFTSPVELTKLLDEPRP